MLGEAHSATVAPLFALLRQELSDAAQLLEESDEDGAAICELRAAFPDLRARVLQPLLLLFRRLEAWVLAYGDYALPLWAPVAADLAELLAQHGYPADAALLAARYGSARDAHMNYEQQTVRCFLNSP